MKMRLSIFMGKLSQQRTYSKMIGMGKNFYYTDDSI